MSIAKIKNYANNNKILYFCYNTIHPARKGYTNEPAILAPSCTKSNFETGIKKHSHIAGYREIRDN